MRKQPKKLALRHETVRQLAGVELRGVVGGAADTGPITCPGTAFDTGATTCPTTLA